MKIFRAALTLPLVACDSQRTAEPPPEVTTTTDSPAVEGTGPDAGGYSVDLPGLPVGGLEAITLSPPTAPTTTPTTTSSSEEPSPGGTTTDSTG